MSSDSQGCVGTKGARRKFSRWIIYWLASNKNLLLATWRPSSVSIGLLSSPPFPDTSFWIFHRLQRRVRVGRRYDEAAALLGGTRSASNKKNIMELSTAFVCYCEHRSGIVCARLEWEFLRVSTILLQWNYNGSFCTYGELCFSIARQKNEKLKRVMSSERKIIKNRDTRRGAVDSRKDFHFN